MTDPPTLARVRELKQLIEAELVRLRASDCACGPTVSRVAGYLGELLVLLEEPDSPPSAGRMVVRELSKFARQVMAEVAVKAILAALDTHSCYNDLHLSQWQVDIAVPYARYDDQASSHGCWSEPTRTRGEVGCCPELRLTLGGQPARAKRAIAA